MSSISASTYNFIATQTLGTATASVTFSNIPQNYTDLIIVGSTTHTSANNNTYVQFNGDTAANYGSNYMFGTGSSASGGRISAGTLGIPADYSSSTTNPSMFRFHLMNYTNTNMYKSIVSRNDEASSTQALALAGMWKSYNPITSLTMTVSAGNIASGSTFTIYGIKAADVASITPTKAIGGDLITSDGTYTYHAFKSTGNFIPAQALTADILVVAGGGGSSNSNGGGGGAGGVLAFASQSLTSGTGYTCTVGAGGAGTSSAAAGASGGNSQFASLTASVGGGGGGYDAGVAPLSGGSGGGGGNGTAGASGTSGQGNAGGSAVGSNSPYYGAAGGGGAGTAGSNGNSSAAGNGGDGVNTVTNWSGGLSSALTTLGLGVSGYIAGGGGGAINSGGTAGNGGLGGAGNGSVGGAGANAVANTGSGGGGGKTVGGVGGSGLIVVRYLS